MKYDKPIRILCADDHPLIRDGIAFAVGDEDGIELVAFATNGIEAVEAFKLHTPDVVLLDLQMPGLSGLQALEAIRRLNPKAKCIVLTTYGGDVEAVSALKTKIGRAHV